MWRLGLDIGSNSIGWAVLGLKDTGNGYEPCKIIDMGVRIFPDGREPAGTDKKTGLPKIGESLAVTRRMARGMRRNRDRRLKRVRAFADKLVEFSLISEKGRAGRQGFKTGAIDMSIDPYAARAKAAVEVVGKEELARALFHLCKRRGFLSNRKTDGEDKEASERKGAMQGLATVLEERGLTLGQYLRDRIAFDAHVRFRGDEFDDAAGKVAIYPTRAMYADEFNAIRQVQGNIHLSDEQWDELFDIFSFQRPLIPKEPGACSFEHGRDGREEHPRAWRHLPISHTFRILQEVNNLRCQAEKGDIELTSEERAVVVEALENQKSMSFSKMRSLLKLPKSAVFNLESARRKKLDGNVTACDMRSFFEGHGCDWNDLDFGIQNDVVQMIHDAKDLSDFMAANRERHWDLPGGLIRDLSKKYYPSSHGHISRRCMEKLLPYMRDGMQYWEAAREVYGDHTDYSQFSTGEVLEKLPYYGEVLRGATVPVSVTPNTPEEEAKYGKIPNPTVHVALNQLRKLINALVKRYGSPYDIHLELARNVKNAGKNYQELLKSLADNTKKNEQRRKQYEECFPGQTPSGLDMVKMRLWEELAEDDTDDGCKSMARMDVYTGRTIAEHVKKAGGDLFRGGAFKPRTSPYSFQGLGEEGLKILAKVRDTFEMPVVTEVVDLTCFDAVEAYADIIQIGTRNMQNFSLLRRAGQAKKPVFLKRGMSATIDEWLMAAEYIMAEGNSDVILCERGVRTFVRHSRNTLDLSAVPVVKRESHLPIMVDPSHAAGFRDQVMPLARAAVAAGAHGIMVEVHHDPANARSDGAQSLYPAQFASLCREMRAIEKLLADPDN